MDELDVCREVISLFFSPTSCDHDITWCKIAVCKRYALRSVPKNSAILAAAMPAERERLRSAILVKPTRTLSGVAPIAVMTSPAPCPHGKCLPCPGGPDHPFASPQSYTGEEPAALRARVHDYDPYRQVQARIGQFEMLGHHAGKVELIVMGGTMTARPREYQEWFVTSCVRAMNEYPGAIRNRIPESGYGRTADDGHPPATESDMAIASGTETATGTIDPDKDAIFLSNETSRVRCVAITFETRPDWCRREHVEEMISLGVTKVELGVQHLDDAILSYNRRGCTVTDTIEANRILRDAGLKVGFHIMPNLPGSSIAKDRRLFSDLFDDPAFRPDFLKIYPTLVTPGSEIEVLWKNGEYVPYTEEEMIDLVAYGKSVLPEYVRLQRIQRDIPAKLIVAGSKHSNFRQLAKERLHETGTRCRCIRCREIGRRPSGDLPGIHMRRYDCAGGVEHFISSVAGDSLIGFARVRIPGTAFSPDLEGTAMLRELHIYGSTVPVGQAPAGDERQHRNFGNILLGEAEQLARSEGCRKIAVMSGIGVRPYYRRHGYTLQGHYMRKDL